MRLQEKIYPIEHATCPKRVHDQAIPPLDRLCASGQLPPEMAAQLLALRKATNPLKLRQEIELLLQDLFDLPLARDGCPEDVHKTLELWKSEPYTSYLEAFWLSTDQFYPSMSVNAQ